MHHICAAEIKTVVLALWNDIDRKRILATASNLTYSSLLAFVPIMAVVFAIARGFGYSVLIEDWFRDSLSSQPEAANTIIGFVNSYLIHTKKGLFLGIGLLFMLWTVLMLINTIESAFNDIWQVNRKRSFYRIVTDYLAMLLVIPIVIVISSGLSIWITALNNQLGNVMVIGPALDFIITLSPYFIWSTAFTALYAFVPNTHVSLRSAIPPGILAGISFQAFQLIYIHSQIWISNYNAVYGSFAIIPFFLLWMQISWLICLIGAELTYCRQNADDLQSINPEAPSFNSRTYMAWQIIKMVEKEFAEGKQPLTALDIKKRLHIPMRTTHDILNDLQQVHLLIELTHDEKSDTSRFLPTQPLENISKNALTDLLANIGSNLIKHNSV